jgi:hypothetical protein
VAGEGVSTPELSRAARALADHAATVLEWAEREQRSGEGWDRLRTLTAEVQRALPPLTDPSVPREGPHHSAASDTERAAALAVMPRSGTLRLRVLEALAAAGPRGLTDYELERRLGLQRPSGSSRRGDLSAGGWVSDSGLRRPTNTGCAAIVWVLSAEGRRRLERVPA